MMKLPAIWFMICTITGDHADGDDCCLVVATPRAVRGGWIYPLGIEPEGWFKVLPRANDNAVHWSFTRRELESRRKDGGRRSDADGRL